MKFFKGLVLSVASIALIAGLTACGTTKQQSQNTKKQTTTTQNQQKTSSAAPSNGSQNKATNASGTNPSSKNNKTKKSNQTILKIKGTVQNVNIQQHDTIVKVKLNAPPKFVSKNRNVSVSNGSIITIFVNATPSQYGPGGGGQKPILVFKKGTQIIWHVTYKKEKDNIKWTGIFDGYLFKKNGVYLDWKGQSFGKNP